MKESDIQKSILEWLDLHGYWSWRMPVGGVMHQGGGKGVRFKKSPVKGFPDIMGVMKNVTGQLFGIEVKTAKGRQSPDQKIIEEKFIKAGCLYILARNLDYVISELKINDI